MKKLPCARLLMFLGTAGVLLCTTGCLEEKETLTVYPSGAGKIHVYQKLGDQLSQMMLSFAPKDKKTETVEEDLYKELGKWQGVTAWSPVSATLENGRVTYEATGYFDDVNALKKTDGENAQSLTWTSNPGGGFKLVWAGGNSNKSQPLESTTDEQQQQLDGMLEMFKGLRIEREVVLPGTVEACTGCTEHKDRSAAFVITGDQVIQVFAMQKDYRQRIASKQITSEKANAEFLEKTKVYSEDFKITSAPGNASAEFEQFKKDYEKAKSDFVTSGTAAKVKGAANH
jgi:hypothetical protein